MTDLITVIGLIASIASLVLAVVAIWLAVVFYQLARDESEASAQNAHEISTGISRLEKVFDGLYSDTFSMMKDTVTDMRQHIWRKDGLSAEISGEPTSQHEGESAGSEPVLKKLEEFSAQLGIADDKIEALRNLLTPVVEESTEKVRIDEHEDLQQRVLQILRTRGSSRPLEARQLVRLLGPDLPSDEASVVGALFKLREKGKITWDGESDRMSMSTRVRALRRGERPEP